MLASHLCRLFTLTCLTALGCSDPAPACTTAADCASGEVCVEGACVIDEPCETGVCEDPDAGPTPMDAGPRPDAGPVDCSGVASSGWELCEASQDACSFVFSDSTGCNEACELLGLVCGESYEDVSDMCAADISMPPLGCADTGHISDYCTCVRGARPMDAGVDAAVPMDAGTPDASAGSCPPDRPWECLLDRAIGFGGAATGGAGGALCWVENLDRRGPGSLQACLDAPGPRWVVFRVSGTIDLGSVNIPDDTTLDGRGQRVTLRGDTSHLLSIDATNVVISNLFLEDAQYDLVHTWPSSRDVWLDHLTLTTAGDELLGLDGPHTTVSWCHFRDNNYATLIGGGARTYPDLWVTLHHNHFTNNSERHPRTRGRVHSFNNVVRFALSGGRVSFEGHLLSERNIYEGSGSALISRAGGAVTVPGHYRSVDDVLQGGATLSTPNDPSPVFAASDHYAYTLDPADAALEARVRAEAGWQDVPLPMP